MNIYNSIGEKLFSIGETSSYFSARFCFQKDNILIGGATMTELYDTKGNFIKSSEELFDAPILLKNKEYYTIYSAYSGIARLMSIETLKVVQEFKAKSKVKSIHLSPKTKDILISTFGGRIKVVDFEGNELLNINRKIGFASAIYSPDGQFILGTQIDGTATLFELGGNAIAKLNKHQGHIYSTCFSHDGKYILTASDDGTAKLWPLPQTIYDWLEKAPLKAIDKKRLEEEYGII